MRTEIVCDNKVEMFNTVGELRKIGYNCIMIFCNNEPRFYLKNNIVKVGKVHLSEFMLNLDKYFKLDNTVTFSIQRELKVYSDNQSYFGD